MKMKHLLEEQPSPDTFMNASSSDASRDCSQDTGSNALSTNGDIFAKYSNFGCFPKELDLNPARMVLAEFMGTFILMFCVCGIMASTQLTGGQVGLLEYAATAGLTVIVLVFAIGPISGAHVNPAVTIAFATFGHFPWSKVPFYVVAQTVGSVLATYAAKLVYGIKADLMVTRPVQGCNSAFSVEFITTFLMMFLAASLAYQAATRHLSGFVIGLSIGLAVLISGPVSGGSLNPARSLGPAIVSWNFKDIWVYIIAPTTGAVAGALMFHVLRIQRPPCSPTTPSPNTGLLGHSINFARR
ncbi:probable aquaporin NIP7-1 [Ricinus communis]|uniref:Aquaporin NIP1.1, putative n=1 Tax=Ricinus communis TaxID=3988 RepID=B9RTV9_RICCO|nr:probable aquaporin NIP7-1 [Ricinus communis]XP_048234977.1 probable aquaporin NIP7-1 [Ricinus communis]EEF45341.1 Aquaporin NIP1.1, putative [Ricinus communis]|eukprot:XP_002517178.1 probable aquaporin NIP7-1 isoform X2 [Ricinus communis]